MTDSIDNGYRDTKPDPYASQRNKSGSTSKTNGQDYDMIFAEKEQQVSVDDFLNLMVAQIKNQDFMNPTDDTQFVTQMAQFATMQQMQELASYSKSNYVSSLIGKTVTASKLKINGDLDTETGSVQKVDLTNNECAIYVNGKKYTLDQIMQLHEGETACEFDASTYSIEAETINDTWLELKWPVTTTDTELADKLKYSVYYSKKPMGKTVEEVETNGTLSGSKDRLKATSGIVMDLEPDTDYYVNVVVTDGGSKTIYKEFNVRTAQKGAADGDE